MFQQEEPTTIKEKIFRTIGGLFLFILVAMLAITFLPGDAERTLFQALSGENSLNAGKIGGESIPLDYFQAARRECYFRYKEYVPSMANDPSTLDSCAYQTIRSLKVSSIIADKVGYSISANGIKEELSKQAREIHKQSNTSAGYAPDEVKSADEIYKSLLSSVPLNYRMDSVKAYGLFPNFLNSDIKKTDDEIIKSEEAANTKVAIKLLAFSDEGLLNELDKKVQISEEELKKEYDNELKNGKLPKDAKGNVEDYKTRKSFLTNKLKVELKQKKLSELKSAVLGLKNSSKPGVLNEIAAMTGTKIDEIRNLSLSSIANFSTPSGKSYKFGTNAVFLKDLTENSDKPGKVGGPYSDSGQTVYVEFISLGLSDKKEKKEFKRDEMSMTLVSFYSEIMQVMSNANPIYRKVEKQKD